MKITIVAILAFCIGWVASGDTFRIDGAVQLRFAIYNCAIRGQGDLGECVKKVGDESDSVYDSTTRFIQRWCGSVSGSCKF
jgi:hypothetical protein